MHRETLDRILSLLGNDEHAAAIEYRNLHQRLARFFEWNDVEDPTALADEAIDRLGRRPASEDTGEKVINPSAFALGIARHLLQEEFRRQQKKKEAILQWETQRNDSTPEAEAMDVALRHCLARMPIDRRELLEQYYTFGGGEKVKLHQVLANDLKITLNALRNRALRARQDLESCMRNFLDKNTP